MDKCASSSSGPPCDAEPSYMSTDDKLISCEHGDHIRGYETKRKTCATLGLQPTEQKMMEAMDKYATGKNESNKTSKKKRKKQKKKSPPKDEKEETDEEKMARKFATAKRSYKCKHLQELRTKFVTKISMERYNSNPEVLKVQSGIFDEMYCLIKDLEVNKSIKFHDLLIFGNDNVGMYLFYYYL